LAAFAGAWQAARDTIAPAGGAAGGLLRLCGPR
jgi:hypothetical protein